MHPTVPTQPPYTIITTAQLQHLQRAARIAAEAVITDIEGECPRVRDTSGVLWYDTRPMLDPREHSPEIVDLHTGRLAYALAARVAERHESMPHLVRVYGPRG